MADDHIESLRSALKSVERHSELQAKYIFELEDRAKREEDARHEAYRRLLKMYVAVRGEQDRWSKMAPSERGKLSLEYQLMERLQGTLEECLSITDDPMVLNNKPGKFGNRLPFSRTQIKDIKDQAEQRGDVDALNVLASWGYKIVMPEPDCEVCDG